MRRPPLLRLPPLAAFAFAVAACAHTEPPLTLRAVSALPAPALGVRLLGPEQGADIVRIETPDGPRRGAALQLFLYARPVPLGPGYCSQRRYYRLLAPARPGEIRPLRPGQELRILSAWDELLLARAPACRLRPGQLFASSRNADAAMLALDDLAAAQTKARAAGPMTPLRLTCRDEVESDPDRCLGGGRQTLAQLPLDRACSVDTVDDDRLAIEVTLCTGWQLWVLRLRNTGPDPALSMLWKFPGGGY